MTVTKFDQGLCVHIDDGKSFILHSDGLFETTDFDTGVVYAEVRMKLPEWLRASIAKAFEDKIAEELNKSA